MAASRRHPGLDELRISLPLTELDSREWDAGRRETAAPSPPDAFLCSSSPSLPLASQASDSQ